MSARGKHVDHVDGGGEGHGSERDGSAAPVPEDSAADAAEMPPKPADGSLYVVATPIGNLQDVSLRALAVLAGVDVVAAEDTRNTARLLNRHRIQTRTLSLHEHNEQRRAADIIRMLGEGQTVAYVTDAGTPGLSDPGAILVELVRNAGLASVYNRCVKIEHARLFGGLNWVGVNTGVISARRPH